MLLVQNICPQSGKYFCGWLWPIMGTQPKKSHCFTPSNTSMITLKSGAFRIRMWTLYKYYTLEVFIDIYMRDKKHFLISFLRLRYLYGYKQTYIPEQLPYSYGVVCCIFSFHYYYYTCICCSFNAHSNTLISIFNFDRRLSVRHEEKFYNPLDT